MTYFDIHRLYAEGFSKKENGSLSLAHRFLTGSKKTLHVKVVSENTNINIINR
ncbi:hypothetical protein HNR44_003318 [Geomicrobium halophilum]|uniref:Uncharacterized protein n=1 Tax=Geomicrobium halophilum TaxID=549000 RepID=A0A841PXC3_9BACL|nr:hypothetical protein [Geomicrobium halophilum]MBB6451311.1 hypothetical protein [Geomicrobium halophilum]